MQADKSACKYASLKIFLTFLLKVEKFQSSLFKTFVIKFVEKNGVLQGSILICIKSMIFNEFMSMHLELIGIFCLQLALKTRKEENSNCCFLIFDELFLCLSRKPPKVITLSHKLIL